MIIKSFFATHVFGYMNFEINFNKDKNFLVGKNGSGKTTALKLINALIMPNFKELLKTQFSECYLLLYIHGKEVCIYSYKREDTLFFGVNSIEDVLEIPYRPDIVLEVKNRKDNRLEEFLEDINYKYRLHPVIEYISEIPSPVFLGLDRRTDCEKPNNDYFLEREAWLNIRKNNITRDKKIIEGSIGSGLMEIELLVKNAYKYIRDLEVEQTQVLRNQILVSSFKYLNFNENELFNISISKNERRKLLKRESEIKKALINIVDFDSSINEEVDLFFKKLNSMFDGMSSENKYKIEFLLNKAQIERMYKIVDIIDEHKSRNDDYYKPINDFLSTINKFYQDSGKRLEIDTVGQLVVKIPDGKESTIESLSSGERQLLVIFAHSYFNQSNIFIIDEPEVSLHLGWQEKLADNIFLANTESQFILATHSPEIIAGNKNKAVGCR